MNKFSLLVLAAGLLLPITQGCSQNSQIVRGQSPQGPQQQMASMPGGAPGYYGGYQGMNPDLGPGGSYCPQPMPGMNGNCPQGMGGAFGDSAYCNGNRWCGPTSYNMYPPQNDVPAVVQYPYYTTKGPDDFFLK